MSDLIDRQAAIDICNNAIDLWHGQLGEGIVIAVKKKIEELPSAQPEKRTEERTETHACDYISRKDAIEAHYEYCNKHPDAGFPVWSLKILEDLPSAQPEIIRCRDCKHRTSYWGNCKLLEEKYHQSVLVGCDEFCSMAERRTDET